MLKLLQDIGEHVDTSIRQSVLSIIKFRWDPFYEWRVSHSILDFEFCFDTGDSTPDCCRQSNYGFDDRKIMNHHITDLEDSGLITDFESSWVSLLLFAAKPPPKDCSDINAFI